jgi:alginate O-acetyltransferase complex protein AlgI
MSFSTPEFFMVFLPIALIGFQLLGRFGRRGAIGFLTLMSLAFYFHWNHLYFFVLILSIAMNYLFSLLIAALEARPKAQTASLAFGIAANLGLLCYFKYWFPVLNFFTSAGLSHRNWGSIILPLGISFFTFTQIAYLIDLKQGIAEREGLLSYSLFVTFFPHLVAGPIIHHKEMMPQFRQERRYRLDPADLSLGLTWFTMGFAKKVLIADRIAPGAESYFSQPHGTGAAAAWLGVLTYSMQLYFDFSGYSDMAVGLARMFSIRFPLNFNSPYKAASIIDFWQRWHMTLTAYILDYVYAPLLLHINRRRLDLGKKVSRKATATPEGFRQMVVVPTMVTMLLVGIWHGAGLQFLAFGLLHGIYLVLNHAWRIFVPSDSRINRLLPRPVCVALTFLAVIVGQVFFRASSLHDAVMILAELSGHHGAGSGWVAPQAVVLAALFAIVWTLPNTQQILGEPQPNSSSVWSICSNLRWQPNLAWWCAAALTFTASMFYSMASTTFLYFQF